MKIIVTAVGSTGDVYPFLAVARLLKNRAEHDVLVIANERFRVKAEAQGIEFRAHGTVEDYERSITPPPGSLKNPFVLLKGATNLMHYNFFKPIPGTFDAIGDFRKSGALLIGHGASFGARLARDAFGLPMISGIMSPTAVPGNKDLGFGPLMQSVGNAVCTGNINRFCAARGLPRIKSVDGWSLSPDKIACLFPAFFDPQSGSWPERVAAAGYHAFDTGGPGETAGEAVSFLKRGPTILFTSGTPIRSAHGLFREAVEVCRRLGRQGLFVTDYAGQVPPGLPGFIKYVSYVSFRRVFPLCEAVVHHGGIGTSLEGLIAGRPQLVTPQIADQHWNAARLKALGVADTVLMNKFSADAATDKLKALLESETVKENCRSLNERMEQEDADGRLLKLVEGVIGERFGGPK